MYTKEAYKQEINSYIEKNGYSPVKVAKKTFEIFSEHLRDQDKTLRENLLDICAMEAGTEFEMTEQEFKQFIEKM